MKVVGPYIIAGLAANIVILWFSAFDGNVNTTPLIGYVIAAVVSWLLVIVGDDLV